MIKSLAGTLVEMEFEARPLHCHSSGLCMVSCSLNRQGSWLEVATVNLISPKFNWTLAGEIQSSKLAETEVIYL